MSVYRIVIINDDSGEEVSKVYTSEDLEDIETTINTVLACYETRQAHDDADKGE